MRVLCCLKAGLLLVFAVNLLVGQTEPAETSDIDQKRFEWFYQQRAYPFETYPAALRLNAIKQMERMLPARAVERGVVKRSRSMGQSAGGRSEAILPNALFSATEWISIGPQPIANGPNGIYANSGRVHTIAVHPNDSNIVYIGIDGGGIWKTTDGGATWVPLTDSQPSLEIRAIALAPTNPNIVMAGTGWGASSAGPAGLLKSIDAGTTWMQISGPFLQGNGQTIYSIEIQPTNSQVVLVGADNGIYRSTDGGNTWGLVWAGNYVTQVLFDRTNANHAFAAVINHGVYQSFDGGQNWMASNGSGANVLPFNQFAYFEMAVAPSSPNVFVRARIADIFRCPPLLPKHG